MRFLDFSQVCERLEGISGRLEMAGIVRDELLRTVDGDLPVFVRFLMGRIFPDWSQDKIGIGPSLVYDSVAYVAGIRREELVERINRSGDPGRAVEEILSSKEQTSFFVDPLDLLEVYRDFEYLAVIAGTRSQREKLKVVRKLFANAEPLEGRYLARLMLGELRIGIGEGTMRDAIADASQVPQEDVEHAFQAANDLGEVALLARQGRESLLAVSIEPFRPVKMMLAKQGTIEEMIASEGAVAAEFKYDGTRFQFHKMGDECRIYSRKLEDVTSALPDIVEMIDAAVSCDVILDGEVIAEKDGRPLPFQYVLRRFRRKHAVASHVEEIHLVPNIFDILYCRGESLLGLSFSDRRKRLEETAGAYVAPQIISGDPVVIEEFYKDALDRGHEGIMVKSLPSLYTPGQRVRQWVKIKPAVDTIDLVVIGAEWGEGRRAHLFGSFLVACQDQGALIPLSKVATGFSDEDLAEIFEVLKDQVISGSGKTVTFEPEIVLEVGYSEIQASQNYPGGYALRFPRFVRLRDDKGVDGVETIGMIKERFKRQSTA